MPTNTLTDARCKSAKPAGKGVKMFDGGGLFLFLTPAGGKIWRMAYRLEGKPKTISFGPYPGISLAEARIKRDEVKAKLRDGVDPVGERREEATPAKEVVTLQMASETFWSGRNDLSSSYLKNATRGIEMHLYPLLGNKPIGDITRADLLDALGRMDKKGRHVYVRKVRMWIGQVFDWAVEHGHAEINHAALIKPEKAFGKATVEHFAALELREIPAFLKRLRMEHEEMQSLLACRLLAHTWVRTTELRLMEWTEIDRAESQWIIPAGKMKRGKDLVVPLTKQSLAIFDQMERCCTGSRFVFAGSRSNDRPMSENAILYLIDRIGYKGRMTGHGWRSVASTWANEQGYTPDAIERQLSHAPENKVRSVYNRSAYLKERREMMTAWSNWLDSCESDARLDQG